MRKHTKQGGSEEPLFLRARSTGEALLLLRHRAGLRRDELAARAKVSTGTVSRYENDATARPDASALRRIVRVLAHDCGHDPATVWHEVGLILDQENARDDPRGRPLDLEGMLEASEALHDPGHRVGGA